MKSGFVGILGRPNVGKSTLLNRLVDEKLAGVSPKPQTTRACVRGILTQAAGQIVYLDTPGLHDPRDRLGDWMMREVRRILPDADVLYWMVLPRPIDPEEEQLLEVLENVSKPVICVINQIDRYAKPAILPAIASYRERFDFVEMIPISAQRGDQVDLLVQKTFEYLPEGPLLFPEDQISDQKERFLVREMISEKLFRFTGEEIPYSATVVIEDFKDEKEQARIEATIYVEKNSQKAIVIGEKGRKIKQIGQAAREDIERLLGKKVFLRLWVKTLEHWRRDERTLKRLGYKG